ncbi:MAG: tRNA 2-thiouridine(34) synthase MnmA [Clostridia bacterium]|nr:tRNA 2-thiouridine(34) synthase MnmA [Clostridia bacterium]
MKEKVLLGMSGGLDSTYAVIDLRARGYEVEGAVLRMSAETDIEHARETARTLGVPLHVVDCTERFREIVIADFLHEYASARTPNPCVICNRYVKIESLCECARSLGIARVATGHYADIGVGEDGRYYVRSAKDVKKDQSYVLWRLTQEQLSMLTFPLAGREKREVRETAKELMLPNADASESQEICFIPTDDYVSYVEEALGKFPEGDFVDEHGAVVGRHRGIIHYTIGQRKGLGLSMGRPVFVSEIDPARGTVTVADEPAIFRTRLVCDTLNFQKLAPTPCGTVRATGRIRYGARPVPVTVTFDGERAEAVFDTPVRAVTPGQSVVFYDGDDVLFGGIIVRN